jgi:hypothetical protein
MKQLLALVLALMTFPAPYATSTSNLEIAFTNNGKGSAYIQWQVPQGASTSLSSIYFTTPEVGSTVSAAVTLLNNGPSTIQLLPLVLSGVNAKDFSFVSYCPTYLQYRAPKVPPGGQTEADQQCKIDLTFKPSAPGARFATLTIPFAGLSATSPARLEISISQLQPPTGLTATYNP